MKSFKSAGIFLTIAMSLSIGVARAGGPVDLQGGDYLSSWETERQQNFDDYIADLRDILSEAWSTAELPTAIETRFDFSVSTLTDGSELSENTTALLDEYVPIAIEKLGIVFQTVQEGRGGVLQEKNVRRVASVVFEPESRFMGSGSGLAVLRKSRTKSGKVELCVRFPYSLIRNNFQEDDRYGERLEEALWKAFAKDPYNNKRFQQTSTLGRVDSLGRAVNMK